MVGNVRIEHGHRMIASGVGFLTLILAFWTAHAEARAGVRRLAWAALAAVIVQGVLGGLTVLFMLPPAISVAHACLAQTFLCIVIALAYTLSRGWLAAPRSVEDPARLRPAAVVACAIVYCQLALGAVMRHLDRALPDQLPLAIPDFPLSLGQIIPPFSSAAIAVHFAHRVTALLVLGAVVVLWTRCRRTTDPGFRRLGALALGLVLLQVSLGATTVLTGKAVLPTTLHVATGAAVLGTLWFAVLRCFRLLHPRAAAAPAVLLQERASNA
jgi:cytochrome c oxidase assembly protein subunit 15